MTGRGRGRGALARWEASKSVGENTTRVGSPISTAVFPLSPKESWEDEIKKTQEDTTRDDRIVRVTHIIDVENFWAQIGKLYWTVKLYSAVTWEGQSPTKNVFVFLNNVCLFPNPKRQPEKLPTHSFSLELRLIFVDFLGGMSLLIMS